MEKKQKAKSFSNSVEKLLKYNKVCYNINRGTVWNIRSELSMMNLT